MTAPTPVPAPPIVFGTDGWRARIGEDYTYENVRRCAQGVAEWLRGAGTAAKGVVVGYDRRFSSEFFAQAAAEVLLAYDIPVAIAREAVPTQMTSYEVVERGYACGVMITASHNPYRTTASRSSRPRAPRRTPASWPSSRRRSARNAAAHAADAAVRGRARPPASCQPPTRSRATSTFLSRSLDLERLKAADMRVLVDPLYGSGAGWIPRLLAGGRIRVDEIHSERNPLFGGVNPEPIRAQRGRGAGASSPRAATTWACCSTATPTAPARPTSRARSSTSSRSMGLLMYYLLEHRGMRQPVVSTINETSMVGRLGERYGVPVHETPVGFKFVGPKMIETGAMMGGEESGGYGFGMHLPERDGIYADLLLLDLFVREREAGRWPVSTAVQHLHDIAGPSFYLRTDVHADRAAYPALKDRLLVELGAHAPAHAGWRDGRAHGRARHRRRLQVLDRRRLLAAGPLQRHRAAGARLRGGDQRGAARCAARRGRRGWSTADERRCRAAPSTTPRPSPATDRSGMLVPGRRASRPGARRLGPLARARPARAPRAGALGGRAGDGRLGDRGRPRARRSSPTG